MAEALGRVAPELQAVIDADLAIALAQAGHGGDAQAQIAANLAAWADDFWVRINAGDALEALGDLDGARAHFEAARAMARRPADFTERSAAAERLLQLSRKEASQAASRRCSAFSELARPAGPSVNAAGSERTLGAKAATIEAIGIGLAG